MSRFEIEIFTDVLALRGWICTKFSCACGLLSWQQKNRGGFTLVEIMIVVAIIALLASVACSQLPARS